MNQIPFTLCDKKTKQQLIIRNNHWIPIRDILRRTRRWVCEIRWKKYTSITQIHWIKTHFHQTFTCLNLVAVKQQRLKNKTKKKGGGNLEFLLYDQYGKKTTITVHNKKKKKRNSTITIAGTAVHDVPCFFRKLVILSSALLVVSLKWPAEYNVLKNCEKHGYTSPTKYVRNSTLQPYTSKVDLHILIFFFFFTVLKYSLGFFHSKKQNNNNKTTFSWPSFSLTLHFVHQWISKMSNYSLALSHPLSFRLSEGEVCKHAHYSYT